jgi:predicted DNA-binding transcriptional regulator YafY
MAPLFRGTGYERAMKEALEYVVASSPRRSVFQDLRRKFVFVAKGGDASLEEGGDRLDELIDAVLYSKTVRITYARFSGKVSHLTIEPLSIVVYEHQLYVIARSRVDGVHPYRFSRISSADILPSRFSYPRPTEYDPDQLFTNSFGIFLGEGPTEEVRVKLAPRWATYALSHRWHRTQQVDVTPRGVIVTVHVRVTPEVAAWILSFGRDAQVLSPPALKALIARDATALARLYAAPKRE